MVETEIVDIWTYQGGQSCAEVTYCRIIVNVLVFCFQHDVRVAPRNKCVHCSVLHFVQKDGTSSGRKLIYNFLGTCCYVL